MHLVRVSAMVRRRGRAKRKRTAPSIEPHADATGAVASVRPQWCPTDPAIVQRRVEPNVLLLGEGQAWLSSKALSAVRVLL
jgi:hypothetical protein